MSLDCSNLMYMSSGMCPKDRMFPVVLMQVMVLCCYAEAAKPAGWGKDHMSPFMT